MQIIRIQYIYNRLKRQLLSHVVFARILILILLVGSLVAGWFILRRPAQAIISGLELVAGKPLPEASGRTNFLILGVGGGGHEGPDIADTIIFVSLKVSSGETTFISIPRDLWISSLRAKINTTYHYGYLKDGDKGGLILSKASVSETLKQPVDFAIKLDFSTFSKAIDILGGVDIVVDKTFDDYKYPISGKENDDCGGDLEYKCRYEHLHFDSGPAHMDGTTALKYVRSRHSDDLGEGTDFARSKRQAKVIDAVKAKLASISNLKNSQVYRDLYALITSSIVTDITPEYYSTIFQLGLKARNHPLRSFSLSEPDLLENPPLSDKYDKHWVLIPKNNNPQVIYDFVSRLLD